MSAGTLRLRVSSSSASCRATAQVGPGSPVARTSLRIWKPKLTCPARPSRDQRRELLRLTAAVLWPPRAALRKGTAWPLSHTLSLSGTRRHFALRAAAQPATRGCALAGYCHTPKSLTRNPLPVLRNCQRMWRAEIATPTTPALRRFQ